MSENERAISLSMKKNIKKKILNMWKRRQNKYDLISNGRLRKKYIILWKPVHLNCIVVKVQKFEFFILGMKTGSKNYLSGLSTYKRDPLWIYCLSITYLGSTFSFIFLTDCTFRLFKLQKKGSTNVVHLKGCPL